jgi:HAD superfamily hydrolase (TIGR01509 family)
VTRLSVLLLDADGNLFPSEEPAFDASAEVTNAFLAAHGIERRFTASQLRQAALGRNFRGTVTDLATDAGVALGDEDLERWVAAERRAVTAHLADVLRPDPRVLGPLHRLAERYELAVVSSSALARLDACFTATGLADLIPPERRFSAEDSLPAPRSKPDPAVYAHAGRCLDVRGDEAVAVEDAIAGVTSARGAGFAVIGNLLFVPDGERVARAAAMRRAGVASVVESWEALEAALEAASTAPKALRAG